MDQSEATTSLSPLALAREDAIANTSPTSRLPIASLSPGARSSAGESGAISPTLAGRWQQRPPGRSRPPPAPLSPPAGRYRPHYRLHWHQPHRQDGRVGLASSACVFKILVEHNFFNILNFSLLTFRHIQLIIKVVSFYIKYTTHK
jgi:hypothetical protein